MILKYFSPKEFTCDGVECFSKMDEELLAMLDIARETAGIPFKINSGYRTQAYQDDLKRRGYKTAKLRSPHQDGVAADISVKDSRSRFIIINSLLLAGFTRLGVGKSFIHVDLSINEKHRKNVIWQYDY